MLEKLRDYLYFYRILNWGNKISGIRPIGYTFLGYLMAGNFNLLLLFLNTLAIFGVLFFSYSINDFFDWKVQKEKNFLGQRIEKRNLKEWEAIILCFFPLFLIIFIIPILRENLYSLYFFCAFFVISVFYSLPPFRFKTKKFLGILIPPLGAFFLFLQGYLILKNPESKIIALAIILFLFQFYLEILHIIDDSLIKEEAKKMRQETGLFFARYVPVFSFVISLIFAIFLDKVFFVTVFFSMIRFFSVRRINLRKEIVKIRKNVFSLELSLYEFLIYGILATVHLF